MCIVLSCFINYFSQWLQSLPSVTEGSCRRWHDFSPSYHTSGCSSPAHRHAGLLRFETNKTKTKSQASAFCSQSWRRKRNIFKNICLKYPGNDLKRSGSAGRRFNRLTSPSGAEGPGGAGTRRGRHRCAGPSRAAPPAPAARPGAETAPGLLRGRGARGRAEGRGAGEAGSRPARGGGGGSVRPAGAPGD